MEDNNTINYISESNRIEVNFSINDYVVSCTITDNKDSLSLQDLLDYLNITEYKENYQISNKLELESGVQYVANVLHKVISVSGEIDRYIFRKIVDYRNSKMHDMLVQYYCDNEIRQAEECWENGEYLKAKDLFERNYKNLTSTKACQNIGELARQQGYSVIKFKSYRAEGINYVIYDNFENILLPRNIVPVN